MKEWMPALAVAALLLQGCGTTVTKGGTGPANSAQAATPLAQPVSVPAKATKKLVLNMTGSKVSVEAKDWAAFKEEWRATFEEHARDAGIAFTMQQGEAKPQAEDGTLLSVYVNDYRMVGIGARVFFGSMTGNAFVDAKMKFMDLRTGQAFGEQTYATSSSAWEGVFSGVTPQQVDAIAAEVFSNLKAR